MDHQKLWQKWYLAVRIMPILLAVILLKIMAHIYGFEVMDLNQLFTSIVAGTIFLLGFLISGVLVDYKESEKAPTELSASVETLFDDGYTIYATNGSEQAKAFMSMQQDFASSLLDWFYRKERTRNMLNKLSSFSDYFATFEKAGVAPTFIVRMKNEQNNLRKLIIRVDNIRDTTFIASAYAVVEVLSLFLVVGMIILSIEPFHEALFFTILVTFLVSYMLSLIKDLDNPFDYPVRGESGTEVSLKPIRDLEERLRDKVAARK